MKRSQRVDKSLVLFRSSFIAKSGESNGLFIIFHEEPRAGWTFFFGAPSLRQTFVNKRTSAEGPSALSSARSALNFPHRCVSDRSISLRNAALLWCKGRPRAQWPLIFFSFRDRFIVHAHRSNAFCAFAELWRFASRVSFEFPMPPPLNGSDEFFFPSGPTAFALPSKAYIPSNTSFHYADGCNAEWS